MNLREQDLDAFFRSKPGLYLVLKPDLTIVDASHQYLYATLAWREKIRGRHLFEIFPDNPNVPASDGVRNLNASLERVLETGAAHRMSVQRYDVPDRLSYDGSWIEKYWAPVNRPVFADGTREITHILHQVFDQTSLVHLGRWLDEQAIVNDEQQFSVKQMLKDLIRRGREVSAARIRLAKAIQGGDDPAELLEQLVPRFGIRGPRRYFVPGDCAPVAGIYYAFHQLGCSLLSRPTFLQDGQSFPPCPRCGDNVLYRHCKHTM